SEVGIREITLAAVSHRKLRVGFGGFRFARDCRTQQPDRLLGELRVVGRVDRLRQQNFDQWRVVRKRNGLAKRCDGLARVATLQQGLSLELIEIWIAGLDLDQAIDLRERLAKVGMSVSRNRAGIARGEAL